MTTSSYERQRMVDLYADTVWRIALSRTRDKNAAEEVFQETFLRLFEKDPDFREDEHVKAWLIRTTLICCKRYKIAALQNNTLTLEEVGEIAAIPEERKGLYQAILRLPDKYRIPIQLYYIEEIPADECAKLLGLRPSSFRSRLCRGKAELKSILKGEGIDV